MSVESYTKDEWLYAINATAARWGTSSSHASELCNLCTMTFNIYAVSWSRNDYGCVNCPVYRTLDMTCHDWVEAAHRHEKDAVQVLLLGLALVYTIVKEEWPYE